ncbi:hypothetical protein IMG5_199710 [Ichthyophthirius multifiliis]|uniref:Lipoyl-binding domain-containing protein n=1 Tax=Ichthyophthirius multifiliis TaxID=5932 RepID=G0R5M2_ICHMU|nr:hypothetical protein IMG5_199710 [Ichthyophthirius multifiliis]EGR27230.1 hypothetical protein IMG5_199710 [Ichthyophthirius multifiliis]|eukprot:XP_004024114.1 hypothetical protein IMG5_199710 [Ichthyophthirius multifiliis]
MGDSITEGQVAQMLKKVGDWVDLDEIVCSVETDKTQVPIRSPEAGIITELFASDGQSVQVGKPFFVIDVDAKKPQGSQKQTEGTKEVQQKQQQQQEQKQQQQQQQQQPQKAQEQVQNVQQQPKKQEHQKPNQLEIQYGEKKEMKEENHQVE